MARYRMAACDIAESLKLPLLNQQHTRPVNLNPQCGTRMPEGKNGAPKSNGHVADDAKPPKGNFFERLAQMTQDDWDRYRVYVYRRWPRISKSGEPHYIAIHREAIDEEFIKTMYGSGRYLLKLNDPKRTVDQHPLEIMDIAYPPKISVDELVDAPENERYYKLWPAEANKKTGDGTSDGGAVRELAGLLKTVMADRGKPETDAVKTTLINWALEQTAKDREQNSPAALANLITALKDVLPAQAKENKGPEKSEVLAIIAAMKDMQPKAQNPIEILQQAKDLFAPSSESERNNDQIEQLDKVLGFAQQLAALRVGAGERNGWDTALDFAKEVPAIVSPILQFIGNTMALRNGGMAAHAAPPGAPAAPASFDPYANPAATAAYARALRNQPVSPPAPSPADGSPTPATEGGLTQDQQLHMIFQQYGQLVLNALNNGVPGYSFAENIVDLFGAGTHAAFANYGKDQLVSAMMNIPGFQIFGQPRLSQFADEFIKFEEFGDQEDGDVKAAASAAR